MKLLLILFLFSCLSANAQEPFRLNKSYPVGWVVWYPSNGTFWITKKATVANTYPAEGSDWTRYYYNVPKKDTIKVIDTVFMPSPLVPVTRASIDSVDKRLKVTEAAQANYTKRISDLENPALSTLKASQWGLPLLTIAKDGTFTLRSLVIGAGLTSKLTDSTIVISVPATKATVTKKTSSKTTKK